LIDSARQEFVGEALLCGSAELLSGKREIVHTISGDVGKCARDTTSAVGTRTQRKFRRRNSFLGNGTRDKTARVLLRACRNALRDLFAPTSEATGNGAEPGLCDSRNSAACSDKARKASDRERSGKCANHASGKCSSRTLANTSNRFARACRSTQKATDTCSGAKSASNSGACAHLGKRSKRHSDRTPDASRGSQPRTRAPKSLHLIAETFGCLPNAHSSLLNPAAGRKRCQADDAADCFVSKAKCESLERGHRKAEGASWRWGLSAFSWGFDRSADTRSAFKMLKI